LSDADDFASEFSRMVGREPEPDPAPDPEPANEERAPDLPTSEPEPIEQAVLRQVTAKQERHQELVDLMHPRGDDAA
jgi:hypothetical protein